jgi:hypothetical protein
MKSPHGKDKSAAQFGKKQKKKKKNKLLAETADDGARESPLFFPRGGGVTRRPRGFDTVLRVAERASRDDGEGDKSKTRGDFPRGILMGVALKLVNRQPGDSGWFQDARPRHQVAKMMAG